jgi:hypothetical protein
MCDHSQIKMTAAWARHLADLDGAIPVGFYGGAVRWVRLPEAASLHRLIECGIPRGIDRPTFLYSDRALLGKAAAGQASRGMTAGVIAHVSRCGSSMLAACMKEVRDVVVLSEPPIVSDLLERDDRRDPPLNHVLALYAQRFGVSRVVVKLLSKQTKDLDRFRCRTGNPRAVVLFRHPVEVAVSNLLRPTLLDVKRNPQAAARDFGGSAAAIRRMSREQFCAWVITRYFRRLVAAPVPQNAMMVDYAQLNVEMVCRLAESFLGPVTPSERMGIAAAFRFHAKRPSRRFRPDAAIKQKAATRRLRAALKEAISLYEVLAARQGFAK